VRGVLEGKLSKERYPYVNREGTTEEDDEPEEEEGNVVSLFHYTSIT